MKLLLRFRTIFKKHIVRKGKFRKDPFCFEDTVYAGFNNFTPIRQAPFFAIWKAMLLARALDLDNKMRPDKLKKASTEAAEDTEANDTFRRLSAKLLEPPKGTSFIQLGSGPLGKLNSPHLVVENVFIEPQIGEAIGPVSIDQLGAVTIELTCPSLQMGAGEVLKTFIKLEINRFDGELYLYGMPGLTLKEVLEAYDASPDYELLKAHIYKGLWQSVRQGTVKEVDPLLTTTTGDIAQAVQARLGVPTYTGDAYQTSFEKSWQTLAQGQPGLCRRAYEVIVTFKENPNHPSLRTHKLSGEMEGVWSISINMAYRIIFKMRTDGKLEFIDIGTHEVYRT